MLHGELKYRTFYTFSGSSRFSRWLPRRHVISWPCNQTLPLGFAVLWFPPFWAIYFSEFCVMEGSTPYVFRECAQRLIQAAEQNSTARNNAQSFSSESTVSQLSFILYPSSLVVCPPQIPFG